MYGSLIITDKEIFQLASVQGRRYLMTDKYRKEAKHFKWKGAKNTVVIEEDTNEALYRHSESTV